jgi:hypothetical protein
LLGVALVYSILFVAQGPIEQHFGLYVPIRGSVPPSWATWLR